MAKFAPTFSGRSLQPNLFLLLYIIYIGESKPGILLVMFCGNLQRSLLALFNRRTLEMLANVFITFIFSFLL